MHTYKTRGTCSSKIDFNVRDGIVTHCAFHGGCDGNAQGLARLATGRRVEDVIALLRGIQCRNGTSCPDQLARALEDYLAASVPSSDISAAPTAMPPANP